MRYRLAALLIILFSLCQGIPALAADGGTSNSAAWLQESISELKGSNKKASPAAVNKSSKPQAVTVTGTGYEVKLRSFRPGRFLPSKQEGMARQVPQSDDKAMQATSVAKSGMANPGAALLNGQVSTGQMPDYKQISRDGYNQYAEAAFDQLSKVAVKRAKAAVVRAVSNSSALSGNSSRPGGDSSQIVSSAPALTTTTAADPVFSSPFVQPPSLSADEEQALNQAVQSSIASGFAGDKSMAGLPAQTRGLHFSQPGGGGNVPPARFGSWHVASASGPSNAVSPGLTRSSFQSYMTNKTMSSMSTKGIKSRATGKQNGWQKNIAVAKIKAEPVGNSILKSSPELTVKPVIASYGRYATRL